MLSITGVVIATSCSGLSMVGIVKVLFYRLLFYYESIVYYSTLPYYQRRLVSSVHGPLFPIVGQGLREPCSVQDIFRFGSESVLGEFIVLGDRNGVLYSPIGSCVFFTGVIAGCVCLV